MVSSFCVEVTLPIPADILWRVRASRAFMQFLVSNGALNRMDASPAREVPGRKGTWTRQQTYVPAEMAIPEIVKPIFDDSYVEIADTQTWSEGKMEQGFEISPSVMGDVVKTKGMLLLEGGNKGEETVHVLQGECAVAIPFLGWYVEQAIIANMQRFYQRYPQHVKDFVHYVVKRWGDGKRENLRMAVEKMLAAEKQ